MALTIELKNVSCGYGAKKIIDNFSAVISSGEIFCLLGPNGIGKTTLFKTMLGVLPRLGGDIMVDGKSLESLSPRALARYIGYVPQSHTPPFAFTAADVILMGRAAHLGVFQQPGAADRKTAAAVMEQLEITEIADRAYTELSGGERQMVLIARALAMESRFMMMDEPTGNLDYGNQALILNQIINLAGRGLGIIMTSHNPEHVLLLRARAALLQQNNHFCFGEAKHILTESNLSETYHVPVAVLEVPYHGRCIPVCQPLLH